MASTMLRSGIQAAIRRGGRTAQPRPQPKRNFSSSAHNDEYETAKWEKITYLGIATCTVLAIYCLSKGHHHSEPPPAYPYLRIRNKEFPWGPNGLFEAEDHH